MTAQLNFIRRIYIVLGIGAVMEFFGHGMWAIRGKEMMIQLVTNSFDNMLGLSVGNGLVTAVVKSIGVLDVVISLVMALAVIGVVRKRGSLYRLAFSRTAIGLYAWAAFWGLLTAASRITAAGNVFPDVLNLIERGPNFLLPTTVLLLTVYLRRQKNSEGKATPEHKAMKAPGKDPFWATTSPAPTW